MSLEIEKLLKHGHVFFVYGLKFIFVNSSGLLYYSSAYFHFFFTHISHEMSSNLVSHLILLTMALFSVLFSEAKLINKKILWDFYFHFRDCFALQLLEKINNLCFFYDHFVRIASLLFIQCKTKELFVSLRRRTNEFETMTARKSNTKPQ